MIADKADIFNNLVMINQLRIVKIATGRLIAMRAPKKVAMPFPPLKPKKMGNMWPRTITKANSARNMFGVCNNILHIIIGIKLLRASHRKVNAAIFFPAMRITLVAPGLFDPVERGEGSPNILQIIIALFIEPIK